MEFAAAVRAVADGGTVVDPEVIARLLRRRAADEPVGLLSPREREVLALMKLGLAPSDDDNRRVLAVLAYLNDC